MYSFFPIGIPFYNRTRLSNKTKTETGVLYLEIEVESNDDLVLTRLEERVLDIASTQHM